MQTPTSLEWLLQSWAAPGFTFAPDAFAAYREAFRDPAVIHATCEDYRAGATIDYLHDSQDQERGRKISCPVLVLWGEVDAMSKRATFLDTWKRWADNVTGSGVGCGHSCRRRLRKRFSCISSLSWGASSKSLDVSRDA